MRPFRPIVVCFSGHDPSGGAGIQADIEVLISHSCHAASVITCLTEQDSSNVKQILPQSAQAFKAQAQTLLNDFDFSVSAFKIGLLGSVEIALVIHELLLENPGIPVVLDPILAAGGGAHLANTELTHIIAERLVPLTLVVTPNSDEARKLVGCNDLKECGRALVAAGAQHVLITGADEQSTLVHNQLFRADQPIETFTWDRLPERYHGSGCTLATSIAALVAQGLDPFVAITEAQEYTWNALSAGYQPGKGQFNPNRFFWVESDN